eukprot:scaffold4659_cov352-Prasinococcus_capsulatus_cf.AAC.6
MQRQGAGSGIRRGGAGASGGGVPCNLRRKQRGLSQSFRRGGVDLLCCRWPTDCRVLPLSTTPCLSPCSSCGGDGRCRASSAGSLLSGQRTTWVEPHSCVGSMSANRSATGWPSKQATCTSIGLSI